MLKLIITPDVKTTFFETHYEADNQTLDAEQAVYGTYPNEARLMEAMLDYCAAFDMALMSRPDLGGYLAKKARYNIHDPDMFI